MITHVIIVDYHEAYEPPSMVFYHDEATAESEYTELLKHQADVMLLVVQRESKLIARRVAESVDQ